MNNLFVYGTLLCEEIMVLVAGDVGKAQPAFIKGFARFGIIDEAFPAIIPQTEGVVSGVVYQNLSTAALDAIDNYEGDWYQRRSVQAVLTNRTTLTAFTYVLLPAHSSRLSDSEWSYEHFCREARAQYIASLSRFPAPESRGKTR